MTTNEILEQAQVFASAWSLVGSRFDSGNEIDNANEQKECLKQMLDALTAERDAYAAAADTMAASHKVERDALKADIRQMSADLAAIEKMRQEKDARMYAEKSALKDAARLALDALEVIGKQKVQMQSGRVKDAIAALKAVL